MFVLDWKNHDSQVISLLQTSLLSPFLTSSFFPQDGINEEEGVNKEGAQTSVKGSEERRIRTGDGDGQNR